ncbi:hypothetical protein CPB86DRAFT_57412 [Serendipita vermifera]|nr:hypothetical protein CPB86DRAFT_57412 [Serendipita vermifera]
MFKTLVVVLCALLKVHAANFDVNVGQTGLTFTPDHVSGAASGDTVTFHFYPSSHSVTQSSLETPCEDLTGGFDSEIRQGSADGSETFVVNVTSTDPIWICCYTPGHCAAGMVRSSTYPHFQANV